MQDIISLDWIGLDWMQDIITLDSPTLDYIKQFLSRGNVSWFQTQLMVTGGTGSINMRRSRGDIFPV